MTPVHMSARELTKPTAPPSTHAQLMRVLIAHGNERALHALRQAGVPLATAQKLILSPAWRKEHKANALEKVKQIEKKGKAK